MDPDTSLLQYLYEKRVVDDRDMEIIEQQQSGALKNEELLLLLMKRSVNDCDSFLLGLDNSCQNHVAKKGDYAAEIMKNV